MFTNRSACMVAVFIALAAGSLAQGGDKKPQYPAYPSEMPDHLQPANPGFPYCVQHCGVAYQAQLPRRDRRPPPPLPFGGPRVR